MIYHIKNNISRVFILLLFTIAIPMCAWGDDKDFPQRPNPPMLVNDLAHTMSADQVAQLEAKLENYAQTSSTQVTVVTIQDLGAYDISDYGVNLFNRWGIGQKSKDNGVLIIAAINNHKINITVGKGLEGVLTDALSGRIIRNEITPAFKNSNYFEGFSKGADAVIAATKGEYKNDDPQDDGLPGGALLVLIGFIILVIWLFRNRGGGGGNYLSRRGLGAFGAGWFLGGGGFGGSSWGGGGSGSGSGGFGGFGGGSSGGGGASGSW